MEGGREPGQGGGVRGGCLHVGHMLGWPSLSQVFCHADPSAPLSRRGERELMYVQAGGRRGGTETGGGRMWGEGYKTATSGTEGGRGRKKERKKDRYIFSCQMQNDKKANLLDYTVECDSEDAERE